MNLIVFFFFFNEIYSILRTYTYTHTHIHTRIKTLLERLWIDIRLYHVPDIAFFENLLRHGTNPSSIDYFLNRQSTRVTEKRTNVSPKSNIAVTKKFE